MPGPLAMAGISLASGLASAGLNRAFNKRPDVPDYSAEVLAQLDNERRKLDEAFDERTDQVEANLAARGVSGSGGASTLQKLFRSNAEGQVDFAARGADAVARAENREDAQRYARNYGQWRNRAQGISNVLQGAGQAYLAAKFGQPEEAVQEEYGDTAVTALDSAGDFVGENYEAGEQSWSPQLSAGGMSSPASAWQEWETGASGVKMWD